MIAGRLRLNFAEVLEDSRCPAAVACFWTGQARIRLIAQSGASAPTSVEFNTNPAPGLSNTSVRVGGYQVTLNSLDPYPQRPEPIPFEDYRATLVVVRA